MQGYDNWKLSYPPDWDYDEAAEAAQEAWDEMMADCDRDDIEEAA